MRTAKTRSLFTTAANSLSLVHYLDVDFEALTTKIAGTEIAVPASVCMRVGTANNTQKTKQHEACGNIYIVVSCDGETDTPQWFTGYLM